MQGNVMYVHGRKCWFCGNYGLSRLRDKRVWCSACRTKYGLKKLKRDLKQYGKHSKVKHSKAFGKAHNHINGIEGFWSYAKERFHKYHGISRDNYLAYVKEMEFRYDHRNEQLYKLLIGVIRQFGPKNT